MFSLCHLCISCTSLYTKAKCNECVRLILDTLKTLSNGYKTTLPTPQTVYLSVKRSNLVNMVVTHGICFCWCIIGMSGVLDSKSYATR